MGRIFSLTVGERLIDVEITHEQVSYHLREGNDIAISVRGNEVKLTAGDPMTIAVGPAERAGETGPKPYPFCA